MIGAHIQKIVNPFEQRLWAYAEKYPVFQTHSGNPKSLSIPQSVPGCHNKTPIWIWHAPYVAVLNTTDLTTAAHYLRLIDLADEYKVAVIVAHVGRVIGLSAHDVAESMYNFLFTNEIIKRLETSNVKLAIEFPANVCDTACRPEITIEKFVGTKNVGWCVDLAHVYASGFPYSSLRQLVQYRPPLVCHANFPGSDFGSGRDIHGWRSAPYIVQRKSEPGHRNVNIVETTTREYDETIRSLHQRGVPLIVEGSQFKESNRKREVDILHWIVKQKNDFSEILDDSRSIDS